MRRGGMRNFRKGGIVWEEGGGKAEVRCIW